MRISGISGAGKIVFGQPFQGSPWSGRNHIPTGFELGPRRNSQSKGYIHTGEKPSFGRLTYLA